MMDASSNLLLDERSLEFLLKEYERLIEYQKAVIDSYHRRFDIYLAIASAAFVGIIALFQSTAPLQGTLILSILAALLVLGVNVFASLSNASVMQVHFERAVRLIQNAFLERDPPVNNFLYFNHQNIGIAGTGFRTLAIRGITGGGHKSILVITNSTILAIFIVQFVEWLGITSPTLVTEVIVGLLAVILGSILHVIYAQWVYRINGI